ncbi:MAG TPA: SCO family protein [Candidatus Angelobacter sp.]|nr:SCO family protein [Candidatus Angelobacter sp.]
MSSKNWLSFCAVIALLAVALTFLPSTQRVVADGPNSHFPNVELITQDGKKVHFYDDLIKGKIVAIDMIYTTCHYACPLETARMAQVQKKLGARVGSDIFFYSISIDPEHDTPQVLKAYMQKFNVGPGWTFLTGKKQDIDFLSKRLGLYSDPSVNADGHLPHLLIGNETTGTWIRGSALDNPSFQARMIGEFLDNFKHADLAAEQKNSGDGHAISNFDRGQYLFGRDCAACHTIGQGDKIGPDLRGVTRVRDPKWLALMIQKPDQLLDAKDPLATALLKKYNNVRMPNVWISGDELQLLIGYLQAKAGTREAKDHAGTDAGASKPANSPTGTTHPNH